MIDSTDRSAGMDSTPGTDATAGTDTTDSTAQGDALVAGAGKKRKNGDAAPAGGNTKGKTKGTRPSKAEPQTAPVGSAKGVETLYRNAYRAELEIIALAATKANIMISLNGFIASALMISGAFIFASAPEFLTRGDRSCNPAPSQRRRRLVLRVNVGAGRGPDSVRLCLR